MLVFFNLTSLTNEDNGEYTLEGKVTDELGAFSKWKVELEVLGFEDPPIEV